MLAIEGFQTEQWEQLAVTWEYGKSLENTSTSSTVCVYVYDWNHLTKMQKQLENTLPSVVQILVLEANTVRNACFYTTSVNQICRAVTC